MPSSHTAATWPASRSSELRETGININLLPCQVWEMFFLGCVFTDVCRLGVVVFSFFSPARAAQTERSSAVGRDQIELPDALLSMASQAKESDVLL